MKRIILFAAVAALASFISCSRIDEASDNSVKINISVSDLAPSTKAVKTGWESGDKINIWFDDRASKDPDLVLSYNGTKWTGTIDDAVAAALKTDGTGKLYGLFEVYNDLSKYSYEASYERFIAPLAPDSEAACGYKVYCMPFGVASEAISYTYDSGTKVLTAAMDKWKIINNVQIVVTGLTGSPSDYGMKLGAKEYVRFGFAQAGGGMVYSNWAYPNSSYPYEGIYTGGVANADGIAFYFDAANSLSRSRKLSLYDFKNNTNLGTFETAAFYSDPYILTGGKVAASKFVP